MSWNTIGGRGWVVSECEGHMDGSWILQGTHREDQEQLDDQEPEQAEGFTGAE